MRISDWSSDVCSSDLHSCAVWKSDKLRVEEIALDCVGKRHGGTRDFDDIHAGQQATEIGIEIFLIGKCLFMRKEDIRSEEHTSELQSLMRTSYAVFCLKKKTYRENRTKNKIRYMK